MDPQRQVTLLPFFATECAVVVHSLPTLNGMKFILGALTLLSFGVFADEGVLVRFWPTKVKPPANVHAVVDDHPCGSVLTIRTAMVPRDAAWLVSDMIHEIDGSGLVLRTWHVPIDH